MTEQSSRETMISLNLSARELELISLVTLTFDMAMIMPKTSDALVNTLNEIKSRKEAGATVENYEQYEYILDSIAIICHTYKRHEMQSLLKKTGDALTSALPYKNFGGGAKG